MSSLDRAHYQLLLELDRCGTLSAASRALYITQSAASQRLREAERRLGFSLTTRTGRNVLLTAAAKRLVEAAHVSERTLATAEAEARWLGSSGVATLQLAVDVYDLTWWLAPLSVEIAARPDLAALEIVRTAAGQGQAAVLEGRADVVIAPAVTTTALHPQYLFMDGLVAVVGADDPRAECDVLTPEDFIEASYVTYSTSPQDEFEYETFFAPRHVWPGRILRVESVTAIIDLVAAGPWLSILPRWSVPSRSDMIAIPLAPSPPAISWSLLSRDLKDHDTLRSTAEYLAERLPALLQSAAAR
ncbi:MAG: LysR family transcriptional regulator [Pseudomonadota bacterium]|nr:LysR family transcriptional regulator [Pseudomonadota bacterium]